MSYEETEAAYNFRVSVENAPHFTADMVFDYLKAQFGGLPNLLKLAGEENEKLQLKVFGEIKETADFSGSMCSFVMYSTWEANTYHVSHTFRTNKVKEVFSKGDKEDFFLQPDVYINTSQRPWKYELEKKVNLFAETVQLAGNSIVFEIGTALWASSDVSPETEAFLRSIPGKVVEETNTVTSSHTSLVCEI